MFWHETIVIVGKANVARSFFESAICIFYYLNGARLPENVFLVKVIDNVCNLFIVFGIRLLTLRAVQRVNVECPIVWGSVSVHVHLYSEAVQWP